MTCTCTHPGCPSHAVNQRATLLAELREVLPDAEPYGGASGGLLMFQSPSTGIQALAWLNSTTPWTFSVASERLASPAAALDALRVAAKGVCP